MARRDYIDAVRVYNTALRTFPDILWAKTLYTDAQPMPEFQADQGAQQAPKVKFGT